MLHDVLDQEGVESKGFFLLTDDTSTDITEFSHLPFPTEVTKMLRGKGKSGKAISQSHFYSSWIKNKAHILPSLKGFIATFSFQHFQILKNPLNVFENFTV